MESELPQSRQDLEREDVRVRYGTIARGSMGCCGDGCCATEAVAPPREGVPEGADLGLSSGDPVPVANLQPGETVIDLGSGAGVDAFLAARRVGARGRVVGVDMTPEMLARARRLAHEGGFGNVEFREGLIERLPVADARADAVISNCVVNLSPDKPRVFREAFRALKPGGRLVVADIVKERAFAPGLPSCGCVDGAMLRAEYLEIIRAAGFARVEVVEEHEWLTVGRERLASAVTVQAFKPHAERSAP